MDRLWAVADWVRVLFRATNASRDWHAPRLRGVSTTTYCGVSLAGPLEIAREDRAEREGRCATCATRLAPPTALHAAAKPAPMKKAAATKAVKPNSKGTSSRASVSKRAVRRRK